MVVEEREDPPPGGLGLPAGQGPRNVYRDATACVVAAIAEHLDGPPEQRTAKARGVAALCVGALVLARAGMDAPEAEEFFRACAHAAARSVEPD